MVGQAGGIYAHLQILQYVAYYLGVGGRYNVAFCVCRNVAACFWSISAGAGGQLFDAREVGVQNHNGDRRMNGDLYSTFMLMKMGR